MIKMRQLLIIILIIILILITADNRRCNSRHQSEVPRSPVSVRIQLSTSHGYRTHSPRQRLPRARVSPSLVFLSGQVRVFNVYIQSKLL